MLNYSVSALRNFRSDFYLTAMIKGNSMTFCVKVGHMNSYELCVLSYQVSS
jgi:hypothetical protein